ncbi:MAG: ferritin family protein [Candidatus Kapaibacterium sp.]
MKEYTLKDAVETAIKAEELGIKFYSNLAQKFRKNTEIHDMLQDLAKDEADHKKQFTDLLKLVPEGKQPTEMDKEYMQGVDISRYFDDMETIDTDKKPDEILQSAYEFEKESVLYYLGIKDMFGGSAVLDEIIKMEKYHMTRLMKYYIQPSKFRGISDEWD